MRVLVDYDMCESNGICEEIASEVFHVSDEDYILKLLQERPPDDLRAKVEEAVRKCPKRALSIQEE